MCREVVIFSAKYFKKCHSHDLETLISELVLKRAFRKCILLPPPFPLPFTVSELQLFEVRCIANSEVSKFSLYSPKESLG